MLSWLKKPTPDFSSRGVAQPPPEKSNAPPLVEFKPPAGDGILFDYNKPTALKPPVILPFSPVFAQGRSLALPPTSAAVVPLSYNSGFSPALETYATLGTSYFAENGNPGPIASEWSRYPAVQDVSMNGFSLLGANTITAGGAITGASLGVSGGITAGGDISCSNVNVLANVQVGENILCNGIIEGQAEVRGNSLEAPTVIVSQPAPGFPGIIRMFDNSGNQNVLKSLDQDLYFNDELLAKAGDIQNVADWSLFPALQNVDMAEKGLANASAVGITDGVFPQFLTPSEKGLNINGSVVGVSADTGSDTLWGVANTAASDATSANVTAGEALAAAEAAQGTADTAEAAAIAAGVAAAAAAATAATALAQSGVTMVNSQTGGILLESTGSTVTITNPSSGRINFEVPAGAGGVASLNTLVGAVDISGGTNITVTPSGQSLIIANTAPTPVTSLNTLTGAVDISGGAGITITPSGQSLVVASSANSAFNYNLYVSNVSGDDTTGDGRIVKPYKTIGRAVTFANTIPDSIPIIINLAAGTYAENVNITRNLTYLAGGSTTLSSSTVIQGTISYDLTGSAQTLIVGGISSVQMYSFSVTNTVARNQSLVLTDVIIAPASPGGGALNCILGTDTSTGGGFCDVTVQNSLLFAFQQPAVNITSVVLNFVNTQIRTTPGVLPVYNGSLITTSGNARISLFGCDVLQDSTSGAVQPLIVIGNTIATPNTMLINSTILQYTSATSDAGQVLPPGKAVIRFTNPAGITLGVSVTSPGMSIINSFFQCQGATTTTGIAPNGIVCIQKAAGGGVVFLTYNNIACAALQTTANIANRISPNVTRNNWGFVISSN